MIKAKRRFPDFKYLFSLIEWKLPSIRRNKTKVASALTIAELAKIAKKRVPKVVFDYVDGSALDEVSYQRSRNAFNNVEFVAHTLKDVSKIDTSVEILGKKSDLPIIFAPTGYTRLMHHLGEPVIAEVAAENNLIYSLSTMGTTSPGELAEQVQGVRRWFQLYVMQNRQDSLSIINQAKDAGFEALILTVDTPVSGIRYRDIKNGLTIPPRIKLRTVFAIATKPIWWFNLITTKRLEFAAFKGWNKPMTELAAAIFDPATKFEDLSWLQSVWSGPIIVKGVQNLDDAKQLAGMGIAGIVLSNHGGRQLERGPVPLELLPEVVAAVGDKVEIYVDGAVLSGQDVYAAITLGAKAVFIGRAYLYGLMAGGKDGVQKVIEILERDLINTMALTGASSIAEGQKFGARIRSN
jgi:isopentenyl diphosphate isomerase/L-lactate dehydrogenase-like FMN-dependent dehydrogenase